MAASVLIRDQAYIKYRNIQSILGLLIEHEPISRTEIARITEMSPTSITRIVGALLALGLVDEGSSTPGRGRGRKAINLRIRQDGLFTLGISLEPHRVALGLLDFGGNLLYTDERLIPSGQPYTPEAMAATAHALAKEIPGGLLEDWSRLRALGVCVAGTVDCDKGTVIKSDQMHWSGEGIAAVFSAVFGLPAYVENDVKACLTGEKSRQGLPQDEDIAYLLVGTGVGVAVTVNGKLLRGRSNEAGEVDNVPAANGGVLQDHLVESFLLRRARMVEPDVRSMEDIMQAYRQEIDWARMLMGDFKRCLLATLKMIDGMYNPRLIILGGSMAGQIAEITQDALLSEHIRVGEDYSAACITGAAIVAQRQAVQTMISREMDE